MRQNRLAPARQAIVRFDGDDDRLTIRRVKLNFLYFPSVFVLRGVRAVVCCVILPSSGYGFFALAILPHRDSFRQTDTARIELGLQDGGMVELGLQDGGIGIEPG